MRDPVRCLRGHLFCNSCVSGWSLTQQNNFQHCPSCLLEESSNSNNNNTGFIKKTSPKSNMYTSSFVYRNALAVKRVICDHSCSGNAVTTMQNQHNIDELTDDKILRNASLSDFGGGDAPSNENDIQYKCEWKGILKDLKRHKRMHAELVFEHVVDYKIEKTKNKKKSCSDMLETRTRKNTELSQLIKRFDKLSSGIDRLASSVDEAKEEYGRYIDENILHLPINTHRGTRPMIDGKLRHLQQLLSSEDISRLRDIRETHSSANSFSSYNRTFERLQSLTRGDCVTKKKSPPTETKLASGISEKKQRTNSLSPSITPRTSAEIPKNPIIKEETTPTIQPKRIAWDESQSSSSSDTSTSPSNCLSNTSSDLSVSVAIEQPRFTKVTINRPKKLNSVIQSLETHTGKLLTPNMRIDRKEFRSHKSSNGVNVSTTKGRLMPCSENGEDEHRYVNTKKQLFTTNAQKSTPESHRPSSMPIYFGRPRTASDQHNCMTRLSSGLSTMTTRVGDFAHLSPKRVLLRDAANRQVMRSDRKVKQRSMSAAAFSQQAKRQHSKEADQPVKGHDVDIIIKNGKIMMIDDHRNI